MSNKGDAAVALNCNVTVKCVDRHGKITREIHRHNKATVNLVDGLIRFLQGHFGPTERAEAVDGKYSSSVIETLAREGSVYIPSCVAFGDQGVTVDDLKDRDGNFIFPDFDDKENAESNRRRVHYSPGSVSKPQFYDRALYADLTKDHTPRIYASRIRATSYEDPNNSEALRISAFIPPGYYVGHEVKVETRDDQGNVLPESEWKTSVEYSPHAFMKNGEMQVLLTELGLFSGPSVTHYLLARVVFDSQVNQDPSNPNYLDPVEGNESDENLPIVQTESSTIIVDWRIGIVSIGDDDTFRAETPVDSISLVDESDDKVNEEVVK